MPQHMLHKKWEIPIGTVHVLAALYPGRLCLAANQGRESLHDRTASDPPTCRQGKCLDAHEECLQKVPTKNAREVGLWEEP